MFRQMIAIDIQERGIDLHKDLKPFCQNIVQAADCHQAIVFVADKSNVDGLLVSIYQEVPQSLMKQLPSLKYIGVLGTSTKKIPMEYCRERGIDVRAVDEYCDDETAEWVLWQMLELFRRGEQPQSMSDKTLGVFGAGAVGSRVIKRAIAFNMKVLFNARSQHPDLESMGAIPAGKEEIFRTSQVISFHTPAHHQWLDADLLRYSGIGLCLVNTCMGRISVGQDLEQFMGERSDVSLIMDEIAHRSYPDMTGNLQIFNRPAYLTIDADVRLIKKFLMNIELAAVQVK